MSSKAPFLHRRFAGQMQTPVIRENITGGAMPLPYEYLR